MSCEGLRKVEWPAGKGGLSEAVNICIAISSKTNHCRAEEGEAKPSYILIVKSGVAPVFDAFIRLSNIVNQMPARQWRVYQYVSGTCEYRRQGTCILKVKFLAKVIDPTKAVGLFLGLGDWIFICPPSYTTASIPAFSQNFQSIMSKSKSGGKRPSPG